MRPRHGIVLGAAVLSGIAAASLASGQPGPRTAVQVIAPASVSGSGPLGAHSAVASVPGLVPAWLLVPTLPDLPVPGASRPSDHPGESGASPASTPAPAPAPSSLAAVLASVPVQAPVALQGLPTLPPLPLPIAPSPVLAAGPAGHAGGHHHGGGHQRG
jgi:hypothetical protein